MFEDVYKVSDDNLKDTKRTIYVLSAVLSVLIYSRADLAIPIALIDGDPYSLSNSAASTALLAILLFQIFRHWSIGRWRLPLIQAARKDELALIEPVVKDLERFKIWHEEFKKMPLYSRQCLKFCPSVCL